MAIKFAEPPPNVARLMGKPGDSGWRRVLRPMKLDLGGGPPTVPAQPVFTVGLNQLLEAREAVETVAGPPSWRYSQFDAGGRPQALEVTPGDQAEPAVASGDDHFSPMIRDALAIARGDQRVRDQEFEARLFRVPALYVMALWLYAEGNSDLFVPLGNSMTGVEPSQVYGHDEFLAALRKAAKEQLSTYEAAERPDELGS